jgi:hypothetical protein
MARTTGQRTQIILGAVRAEVSLVKVSSEPSAAKWETRKVPAGETITVDLTPAEPELGAELDFEGAFDTGDGSPADSRGLSEPALPHPAAAPLDDPLGAVAVPDRDTVPLLPQNAEQAAARDAMAQRAAALEPPPDPAPAMRSARGITLEDGTWVELTDELENIDDAARLDGLTVAAAIPAGSIPRERVRDASWVTPVDELGAKVRDLLYEALADANRALAVRWTKRTNQALGIIVASKTHKALMLLEVEWSANMKAPPVRALYGAGDPQITDGERKAAAALVTSLAESRGALDDLHDERRRMQAELIAKTKAGEPFALPETTDGLEAELAAMLAGAS